MLTDILYLLIATALSTALYPFWIDFIYKFQMGEKIRETGPQTHIKKGGTPTMGGMVFILVVAVITFLFNRSRDQTLFPLFVASLAGFFGLLEDLTKVYKKRSHLPKRSSLSGPWHLFKEFWATMGSQTNKGELQTYQKFFIQATIGAFVAYWTYFKLGWDYIWFPLMGNIHLGFLYPIIIFFLFIVVLNFIAFTDGLDGLAGGLSLIAFCAFWVIAVMLNYNSLAKFCATFVGALLPFLYFNVYPARVFMGNIGSHVLGATLLILAIVLHREVAFLFIGSVFLFDGLTSPIQSFSKKLTGKKVFRMAPIHHHFEMLGWPETKVVFRFWVFGMLAAFVGVFVALL